MISSPSDVPALAVDRERQLLEATTKDLVDAGLLEIVVLADATLPALQRALLDPFHVFHFIGHGGFDRELDQGVLVLERDDNTAHRVTGARLGTLLHDARDLQLAVLNACEGARSSGRDAFSGVGQALVRQGLPAVVAMQTEISDRAALVFSHELYSYLTRGLGIETAICEVRKAMATSDEASEWGTAVLLRSAGATDEPFTFVRTDLAQPGQERRWESLYAAARGALATDATSTAVPMLEQLAAERPDYADVTALLEQVRAPTEPPPASGTAPTTAPTTASTATPAVPAADRRPDRRPRSVRHGCADRAAAAAEARRPASAHRGRSRSPGAGRCRGLCPLARADPRPHACCQRVGVVRHHGRRHRDRAGFAPSTCRRPASPPARWCCRMPWTATSTARRAATRSARGAPSRTCCASPAATAS